MASASPTPWTRVQNPDGTSSIHDAAGGLVAVVHNGDSHIIVEAPALMNLAREARAIVNRAEGRE